jgi:signal transduction histidine kinase
MTARSSDPEAGMAQALLGGGAMGARIRGFDWASTALGPIARWPTGLKTSLSLILGSQMPMWIGWGPDCIFFYNDAYVQVLGAAKHPWALGRPAAEVWAEIWHICGPLAERVFRDAEGPLVEDVRLFMNRGDHLEEVYYSFSYSPIRDDSGAVAGLFCPNTEVTAKIIHARRLRTLSELAARALIERTTAAACASAADTLAKNPDDLPFALVYLAAPDGTLALEQAVRLPAGTPYSPLVVARAGDGPWPLVGVLRSGATRTCAVEPNEILPLGLAEQRVAQAVVLPVAAAGHERALGVMVAGVNPTRALDREYAAFFELLAAHVATAIQNATVVEQEMRRADMLAALDRAKTTFFSNVSHEFRTPLTLMIGPTEDALAGPDPALRGEALQTVYRNELRLLKLVNALLEFSRLEAGRMVAVCEPVDLAALTADLASGFRSAIERAGLRFEVDTPPLPTPVSVDRDMWERIVLNLLSNALKFTLEGSIRVSLRARGDRVELCVADTGSGIPKDEMPRLFERFHRIDNPRARTHEGTGIGLALVQELTRLHGGEVTVDSEVGRGTVFCVTIPIAAERVADARRTTEATTSALTRSRRRGGGRRSSPWRPGASRTPTTCCSPTTTPTCASTWCACSASTGA